MNFRSIYAQGFARVAACTGAHAAIADPHANAEAVLRQGRHCADEGWPSRSSPSSACAATPSRTCSSRTCCSTRSEQALATVVAGSPSCSRCSWSAPLLRHRNRIYNCAVVVHRGGSSAWPQVVPAELPRVLRAAPARAGRRRARRHHPGRRRGRAVRRGPAVRRRRRARARAARGDLRGHVGAGAAERRGRPRGRHRRPQPARAARSPSAAPRTARCCPCRSSSARYLSAYVYAAAGLGESTTDLSWDGQTMIYENGVLLAETERCPAGRRFAVADVDLDLLRQERMRMGTFDDNRRTHATDRARDFRQIAFTLDPPTGRDLGLRRRLERFPFVPADAAAARPGLLRGVQHPGQPGCSNGSARSAGEGRHRCLRRSRLDARADRRRPRDGPGGPPRTRHPRLHDARLRHRRPHQEQCARPDEVARRHRRRAGHHGHRAR